MTTESENPEIANQPDPGLASDSEAPGPSVDESIDSELDNFKPGDALRHPEADHLCARQPTTVVVLAGGIRSGKTTLLTSLYEHLHQEPLADWRFAESKTLFGFERRCHGGRRESGLDVPNIQRSSSLQPPWLHLDLVHPSAPEHRKRFLFADISGEWFEGLIDGTRKTSELPHLRRADQLAVVLDGRKLATSGEEQIERSRAETLIRVLREEQALVSESVLSLVVAKLDELLVRDPASVERLTEIGEQISSAAGLDAPLPMLRTAARPKSGELPAGHGLIALFDSWCQAPLLDYCHPTTQPFPATAFSRFPPAVLS
jgi:hypothetical protein